MITQRMLQAENLLDSLPAKGIILATTTEAFSLHAAWLRIQVLQIRMHEVTVDYL